MPIISWNIARQLWRGKMIIIQMEGILSAAWCGIVRESYYEPVGLPLRNPNLHNLRIVYNDTRFIHRFPNWRVPLSKWHHCGPNHPHLIIPSRITDLCVTEDDPKDKHETGNGWANIPEGDLWCTFEIPEEHRVPNFPWYRGYFVVQMGDMSRQVLAASRRQKAMYFRRF